MTEKEIEKMLFTHMVETIFRTIRMMKNSNLEYVLDDNSAKINTRVLLKYIRYFNFDKFKYDFEEYMEKIEDILNNEENRKIILNPEKL